jgi:glucose-6-phosphate 1-dehydrogenase
MNTTLVIFGATGDLAQEKLFPAAAKIKNINIVGYSRKQVKDSHPDGVEYVQGDFKNPDNLLNLLKKLNSKSAYFYLALPPSTYMEAVKFIARYFKQYNPKIALEKPFGTSFSEAKKIKKVVTNDFYLVDHYLAKKVIRQIVQKRVELDKYKIIQLSLLEHSDVSKRGKFYDQIGVIKDVGQNHLINTLDKFFKSNGITDFLQKAKYLDGTLVLGQYNGYTKVGGVAKGSITPTYFKAEFRYNKLRVLIRSGKALNISGITFELTDKKGKVKKYTDVHLKQSPHQAHIGVLTDFIQGNRKLSLDLDAAVNSWKVIDQLNQDIIRIKPVVYSIGSSFDAIEDTTDEN